MNSTNESPLEEAKGRIAEEVPIYMLPRVIAAEDYRLSQAAYRARVDAAHAAGWAALGASDALSAKLNAKEEMGDITIKGDTYQYFGEMPNKRLPAPEPAVQPQTPTTAPTNGVMSKFVLPALVGAGLLGTGAGGAALYNHLKGGDPPAVVEPTTEPAAPPVAADYNSPDWKLGAEVKDRE